MRTLVMLLTSGRQVGRSKKLDNHSTSRKCVDDLAECVASQ
jgi:hypothetical protein